MPRGGFGHSSVNSLDMSADDRFLRVAMRVPELNVQCGCTTPATTRIADPMANAPFAARTGVEPEAIK